MKAHDPVLTEDGLTPGELVRIIKTHTCDPDEQTACVEAYLRGKHEAERKERWKP